MTTSISVATKPLVPLSSKVGPNPMTLSVSNKIHEMWSKILGGQDFLSAAEPNFYSKSYFVNMQGRVDVIKQQGSLTNEQFDVKLNELTRQLSICLGVLKKTRQEKQAKAVFAPKFDMDLPNDSDEDSDFRELVKKHDQKAASDSESDSSWENIGSSKSKSKKKVVPKEQPVALIPTSFLSMKEQGEVLSKIRANQLAEQESQRLAAELAKKMNLERLQTEFHEQILAGLKRQPKLGFTGARGIIDSLKNLVDMIGEIFQSILELIPTDNRARSFELYLDDLLKSKVHYNVGLERTLNSLSDAFRKIRNPNYVGNNNLDRAFITMMRTMVERLNQARSAEQLASGIEWNVFTSAAEKGPNAGRVLFSRAYFISRDHVFPRPVKPVVEVKVEEQGYRPNVEDFPSLGASLMA